MNRTFAVAPPGAERNPNTGLRVTGNRSTQASEDIGRFLPKKSGAPTATKVESGKSALPEGGDPSTCYALANQTKGTDDWCLENCGAAIPVCPDSKCVCSTLTLA